MNSTAPKRDRVEEIKTALTEFMKPMDPTDGKLAGAVFSLLLSLLMFLLHTMALPFEVLLRKNLGERYLTFGRVVLSYLAIHVVVFFSALVHALKQVLNKRSPQALGDLTTSPSSPAFTDAQQLALPVGFFILLFFAAALVQMVMIQIRNQRGITHHSKSWGDSHDFWQRFYLFEYLGEFNVQQWIEPMVILIIGMPILLFNQPLGVLFITGAISMCWKGSLRKKAMRNALLDDIDAEIEAEARRITVERAKVPSRNVKGYSMPVVSLAPVPLLSSLNIDTATQRLDPRLQSFLAKASDGPPHQAQSPQHQANATTNNVQLFTKRGKP